MTLRFWRRRPASLTLSEQRTVLAELLKDAKPPRVRYANPDERYLPMNRKPQNYQEWWRRHGRAS